MRSPLALAPIWAFATCLSAVPAATAANPQDGHAEVGHAEIGHAEIDRAYHACLDQAGSTAKQLACVDQAYGAWDKVLNEAYKAAMAHLSPKNQDLLREAQRKWLAYRDADSRFQAADWTFGQGNFIRVVLADASLQIVRARALVLESYISPGD